MTHLRYLALRLPATTGALGDGGGILIFLNQAGEVMRDFFDRTKIFWTEEVIRRREQQAEGGVEVEHLMEKVGGTAFSFCSPKLFCRVKHVMRHKCCFPKKSVRMICHVTPSSS